MYRLPPFELFTGTVVGATGAKTLFPNATYTATLPSAGSGQVAPITVVASGFTCGGIFAPDAGTPAVLIDFLTVSNADTAYTIEIGKLNASGGIMMPLGSVAIKSITTAGTVANVNPYTGVAVPSTTFRLVDLATITGTGSYDQLSLNMNGTEGDQPAQLMLTTDEACWYYAMVTVYNASTSVGVYLTKYSSTLVRTKAGP